MMVKAFEVVGHFIEYGLHKIKTMLEIILESIREYPEMIGSIFRKDKAWEVGLPIA